MHKNFIEELKWRGMINNITEGAEAQLLKEPCAGYIGFDPTADSLHIGSLVQIMILTHFQNCGNKPIALIGGATGMIGDPSGKSEERKLLTVEDIRHNEACIKKQLEKFLDFTGKNAASIENNNYWFQNISIISFLRDVGKYLTVSYLLSKGFVKDRMSNEGDISFTEFNYILMQAYDFMWLYENKNCKFQMGGSDQWGNITAGIELIRKKLRGEASGITCNLLTKSDGSKFGKTETGNIWLDSAKTSVFKFYQFWLNVSDEEAQKCIRIFSLTSKDEIEALETTHKTEPHLRKLQKALAEEITTRVHSAQALKRAQETTEILFGSSFEDFKKLSPDEIQDAFDSDVTFSIDMTPFAAGIDPVALLAEKTHIFPSKGEARKMIQANGVSINKQKISLETKISGNDLLYGKFLLIQKGKKNYFLIQAS